MRLMWDFRRELEENCEMTSVLFVSFFIGCSSIQNPNKVVNTDKNKIHRFSTDIRTLEINFPYVTIPTITCRLIPQHALDSMSCSIFQ